MPAHSYELQNYLVDEHSLIVSVLYDRASTVQNASQVWKEDRACPLPPGQGWQQEGR